MKYRVIDSLLKNYDPYRNEFMAKSPSAVKGDGQIHGKKKKKKENTTNNISKPVHELSKLECKN